MQTDDKSEKTAEPKRHRRKRGVPFNLVMMLVALALICGGTLGYVGGAKFSSTARELEKARAQASEYELTLMELYAEEFEKSNAANVSPADIDGNAALTGEQKGATGTAEAVVVAEFNGGNVMSDEARDEYEATLANYVMSGTDVTDYTDAIKQTVLETLVGEKLAFQKAVEKGYTTFTEADRAKISQLAKAEYDDNVEFYVDLVREDGMTDEEALAAAQEYLASSEDYTLDSVTTSIEAKYWYTKLYDDTVSTVTVSSEDVLTAYNEQVAVQKARYDSNIADFENALLSGDTVMYFPAGYRRVKQILISLDADAAKRVSEIEAELAAGVDEEKQTSLSNELDNLYADAEAKAKEVFEKLDNGGDFDKMLAEYGDDEGMTEGIFAASGYYVCADSVVWADDFVAAGMALAAPGDYSEPFRSDGAMHIIRYIANVDAGAVPLSQVTTEITEQTLDAARFETYQEKLQAWISEADVKYYPERLVIE